MCYMSRNILVRTCIITREKNVQWPGLETGWWGPRPQCNEDVSWERGVPHGFWGPGFWNAANHGGFRKRCHEWHCASGATDPPWNRHVFKRLPRIIGSDRWTIAYISIRRLAWPNIMLSSRHLATLLTSHYGSLFASLVDKSRLLYQLPKICSSNNIKPVFQLLQNRLFFSFCFQIQPNRRKLNHRFTMYFWKLTPGSDNSDRKENYTIFERRREGKKSWSILWCTTPDYSINLFPWRTNLSSRLLLNRGPFIAPQ